MFTDKLFHKLSKHSFDILSTAYILENIINQCFVIVCPVAAVQRYQSLDGGEKTLSATLQRQLLGLCSNHPIAACAVSGVDCSAIALKLFEAIRKATGVNKEEDSLALMNTLANHNKHERYVQCVYSAQTWDLCNLKIAYHNFGIWNVLTIPVNGDTQSKHIFIAIIYFAVCILNFCKQCMG